MIESELKITLDRAGLSRLRRHPALAALRLAPRRSETLVSVYYDTPGHALAAAGVSLRLRRVGRMWVQTVKQRAGGTASSGFYSHLESECAAPGGRLVLDGPDPDGVLAAISAATDGAPLSPIFETRMRRVVERLAPAGTDEVELALDDGEIRAGDRTAPIREAEFELKSGDVAAVFDVARRLFETGPVRFAASNKAARGYRLLEVGEAEAPSSPVKASVLKIEPRTTVETVAGQVLRDCLAQIAGNMAVIADSDAIEGPHQLRIGLRRLRTALSVLAPSLGREAVAPVSETARELGRLVGRLRDADVLIDEVAAPALALGLDSEASAALLAALEARRSRARAEVRTSLAASGPVGFLFDLGRFVEGRGWLVPGDYGQTERLAAPIDDLAPAMLGKRHRRVMKAGRKIRKLDADGLHALRKELKKLRYTIDMLGPIYPADEVAPYLSALKELQDGFGSLNDAAMAQATLSGPDAPAPADPAAQRGIGWVLGTLTVRVADDRPRLFERWGRLHEQDPFWE